MSISEEREKRQIKVFIKWVNSQLGQRGRSIAVLEDDFDDGVNLCHLYEIISGEKVGKIIEKPKNQLQRTQNLALACAPINKFVKEIGIGLQYGPQQIENGDSRAILGLLWILITKFVLPESEDDKNRKRALLKWVQKVTEPYDNVNVKNFTKSWSDGLAFNALLDQYDDSLMDYSSLTKDDATGNCKNAFDIAENIGITRLLDEEDVADQERPDEKSIVMQVALYYQHFHKGLAKKLEKECEKYKVLVDRLLKWINENIEKYGNTEFDQELTEARELLGEFPKFLDEKNKYSNFKAKIMVKLATIQRTQKKEKLKVFIPGDDYALTNLHQKWMELNKIVIEYANALKAYILKLEEEQREKLNEYDASASEVLLWIFNTQKELTSMGETEEEEKDEELPAEESTDEETRNKRQEAVEECKGKVDEVLEAWANLPEEIKDQATCTEQEIQCAVSSFKFAMIGEEDEELKAIRKFELEEESEE